MDQAPLPHAATVGSVPQYREESSVQTLADKVQEHLKTEERLEAVKVAVKYFRYTNQLEGILKTVVTAVVDDQGWGIDKVLEDQRDLDGRQSVFKEFANECLMLLELLPCMMTICKMYQKLYMAFLPEQVSFKTGWFKSQTYTLVDLDNKGHGRYFFKRAEGEETEAAPALRQASQSDLRQPLVENKAGGDLEAAEPSGQWLRHVSDRGSEEQGRWVSCATEDGQRPGRFFLFSPLLTDPGLWRSSNREDQRAGLLRVQREGVPIVSCNSVRELRECFGRPRSVGIQNILDKVRSTLAGLFEERKDLVEWACEMVEAMCDVTKKLDLGNVNKPKAHNLDNLFSCLLDLCKLCNETSIHDKLVEKLSVFGEQDPFDGPLAQCVRYNSRGLCLSDLHDSTESFLPRFLHRLCLRSWQGQDTDEAKIMHVNLDTRKVEDSRFVPKHERLSDRHREVGHSDIRFVTISDTHGWDADLELPDDGDVLLHCGNLLFQSGPLTKYHEPPQGLKDLFDLFRRDVRFKRYKAIVIVGGSHDRALFELWLEHPKKLLDMMPKNVVLLQHKSLRESFGVRQPEVVGSGPRWKAMEEGVVYLKPVEEACKEGLGMKLDIRICCASEKKDCDGGWIVAGSGVSVAQGHRRAFQLKPGDEEREKRRKAARTLVGLSEHEHIPDPTVVPDIVLSHGPPKPRKQGDTWDEGRGDNELKESLAKVHEFMRGKKPKVVIFGGGRREHGIVEGDGSGREGFAVVGAALSAHFYVPARPPIVFDEAVGPDISKLPTDKTGWEQILDALRNAVECLEDLYMSSVECANTCMAPCKKFGLPKFLNKFLKKEVRLRWSGGIPTVEELPPQHLVAHWIPRGFIAPGVLDVFERKWRKACKKARKAEGGREAVLFAYELSDHRESGVPLLQKLEAERLKMDVPEAVWKDYLIIVDKDGKEADKAEELKDSQFPVRVCFPKEAAEQAKLSEFDVSGPVVLFGMQALLHWIMAPPLTMLAYATTIKPPGGGAFLEYDPLCWGVFGVMFWHLWRVQKKCLSYLVLPQVHVAGSGFSIFGSKPSFTVWTMFIWVFSLVGLMDISAQCLFYGQFIASVETNPRIGEVWRLTIYESFEAHVPFCRNITQLFTVCWLMMFAQLGYMLLHIFPMHEKMHYDMGEDETHGSMPQGYTVLVSRMMGSEISVDAAEIEDGEETDWLWLGWVWLELRGFLQKCKIALLELGPNLLELCSSPELLWEMATSSASNFVTLLRLEKPRKKMFKFWHADIIRVLATYGRMTAVLWSEKSLVQKRLEMELKKKKDTPNVARFFQIMFNRTKDFLMRAILMDILEKAIKLEVQISVFSIDLALQQDQSSKWRACNKQMLFAIVLSFVSAIYALWSQSQTCRSLFKLLMRCEEDNMGYVHYKNLPGTRKSMNSVQRTLWCYCLCLVVMGLFIFHCVLKVIMAFSCQFAIWNLEGCVCFHSTGDVTNRTLILDNTLKCTLH